MNTFTQPTVSKAACKEGVRRERIPFWMEGSERTSRKRDCGWAWIPKRDGIESRREKVDCDSDREEGGTQGSEGCWVRRGPRRAGKGWLRGLFLISRSAEALWELLIDVVGSDILQWCGSDGREKLESLGN